MNSNVLPAVIQIDRKNLKNLVTEVKETLATDLPGQLPTFKNKKFGIIDLWNCQKTLRTAASRRSH
jgi:hypothetical protein